VLDLGPLLLFFFANMRPALFAPLLAPFLRRAPEREHAGIFARPRCSYGGCWSRSPSLRFGRGICRSCRFVTAVIVVVFGGLTLALQNETFIKLSRPSSTCCSASCCSVGLAFGKSLLGMVFDSVFHLTDEGWRKLTLRWALFFSRSPCSTRSSGAPRRPTSG